MNAPFSVYLEVEQVNVANEAGKLTISSYPINITLEHTAGDIKQLIWKNSQDYSLKPIFLTIKHYERKLHDKERLCDVLQTTKAPEQPIFHEFSLTIDYTLFNSPSLPRRDPTEELFDIIFEFDELEEKYQKLKIRETLDCTIGVLKDYIVEERAKRMNNRSTVNKDSFDLILASGNEVCSDSDLRLNRVLKLDVTPLSPILFKIQPNDRSNGANGGLNRRFHIKITSAISALDEGNNLFEVNSKTTIQDFKNQIVERIDYQSVRRTFFDQIRLYYATQLIENTSETNNNMIYDVLLLNEEALNQTNGIITMSLEITHNLSGNGGVLSRDFWQDLRSVNRFEFSQNGNNDLRNIIRDGDANQNISPIEPTRIVLEGGAEWNLAGETFEVIQPNVHPNQSRRRLLVNQTNLASVDYEFALQVGGANMERKVILNTSQCIIVDNGNHQPYVLLSPSGAARLNAVIRLSHNETLIQKVNVLMYDDYQNTTRNENPNPQADIGEVTNGHNAPHIVENRQGGTVINIAIELMRNNLRRWLSTIMRCIFLIYILGINTLFMAFWKEVFSYGLIFGTLYLLFFAGNDVANWIEENFQLNRHNNRQRRLDERLLLRLTNALHFTDTVTTDIFSVLKNEAIRTAIERTRQHEYVFRNEFGQDGLWFYVVDTFTNLWKDVLLMTLTLFPSFYSKIYEELETWRSNEIDDLALEVGILRELTIDAIGRRRQGLNNPKLTEDVIRQYTGHAYDELVQDSSESYMATENRYQLLIEYYIQLHKLHTDLDRVLANYGPDPSTSADHVTNLETDELQASGSRRYQE